MRCRPASLARRAVALALALAAAALVAACGDTASRAGTLALTECRLPRFAQPAQCGTLEVPEDRAHPDGRRIKLFIAVLPANTLSPRPDPLFILAGGPGQAASQLGPFAAQLNGVRRTRDLVLVDQRGTGRSAPLDCFVFGPDQRNDFETDPVPRAKQCADELKADKVDAAQYTTSAWVADLDAVRAALGYPRVNLWGGSYGSRVALEYLRRHPDRVRSAVLDGVVPPEMRVTLDVWRSRDAALSRVIESCRKSPFCTAAHADPEATLAAIARDLGERGRTVAIADPRTGATQDVPVTFDFVLAALQPLIYVPELASMIPEILTRAKAGDYGPLVASADVLTANLAEQMNAALHYSVTCAEDVPRLTDADRAAARRELRAGALAARIAAVCDVWPKGTMPADFGTAVKSDVPVLILSGELDPVTPPTNGDTVAKSLANSRHVVVKGMGHVVSAYGCVPRLIASFIDTGGFAELSPACLERLASNAPPPLWPDRLAPQP